MKKALSILLALAMVLALVPATVLAADSFTDIDNAYGKDAVQRWTAEGVFAGFPDGTFKPDATLRRGEAMVVFNALLHLEDAADLSGFTDIPEGTWYYEPAAKALAAGVFLGYGDGTMQPERPVDRQTIITTVASALGIPGEDTINENKFEDYEAFKATNPWSLRAINAMYNLGAVAGVTEERLAPTMLSARQQFAVILDNLIGAYITKDGSGKEISGKDQKFTLVVAKDVKLTGAYNGFPVVLYGKGGKVDMSGVSGTAKVNVMVPNVTVTGAAPGTTFIQGANGAGLTVNGRKITDKTYVVPDRTSGGYTPSEPGPSNITVTYQYEKDGTTVTMDTDTKPAGSEFEIKAFPQENVPENSEFVSWKDANGNAYAAGEKYTFDSSITLTADFIEKKDVLANAIKGAMDKFNDYFKDFESLGETDKSGYTANLDPLAFSATESGTDNDTREQHINFKGTISTNFANNIVVAACEMATVMLTEKKLDTSEARKLVDEIFDALEGLDITTFRDTEVLKQQVTDAVKAASGEVATGFKAANGGSYCFGTAKVKVNGSGEYTITANGASATLTGAERNAAIKDLAVAIAKELYSGLDDYTTKYAEEVKLTAMVNVTFDGVGTSSNTYPTKYPFVVNLTLNGGGIVSAKWVTSTHTEHGGELHIKVNGKALATKYDSADGATKVINEAIEQMNDSLDKVVGGMVEENGPFKPLISSIEKFGIETDEDGNPEKQSDGTTYVKGVLTKWLTANLANGINGTLASGTTVNTEIEELVDAVAKAAAEELATKLREEYDKTTGLAHQLIGSAILVDFVPVLSEGDTVNHDVAGLAGLLKSLPDGTTVDLDVSTFDSIESRELKLYIYSVICDTLKDAFNDQDGYHDYDYTGQNGQALTKGVKDIIDKKLEEQKITNIFDLLKKLTKLSGLADTKLKDIETLVTNETVKGAVDKAITEKLDNAASKLPEAVDKLTVKFTVGDDTYTIDSTDFDALKNHTSGWSKTIADMIDNENGNSNLCLNSFDVKDGNKVEVTYNGRTFVFYLWLDMNGNEAAN